MMDKFNLQKLSEIKSNERSFLTVYLPKGITGEDLEDKFDKLRKALKSDPDNRDELEYFNENVKVILSYLKDHPVKSKGICLVSGWVLDFFQVIEFSANINEIIWIDSSPYIRPLAEQVDEYENYLVVLADNNKTKVFLVTANKSRDTETIKGNIKNHVKVGGWSQQRYERRRDKQLLLYAKEVVDYLKEVNKNENFKRIILVGGKEAVQAIFDILPDNLNKKAIRQAVDLSKNVKYINQDIWDLFVEMERKSEADLWEKIRVEYLRGGRAVAGIEDVMLAAREYRIDSLIIERDLNVVGQRCRECGGIQLNENERCISCKSVSLFEVDAVNEIIELVKQSGGEVEFADPISTLENAGHIAAYLRY